MGVSARDLKDLDALNNQLEASVGKGLKSGGKHSQAAEVDEIVSKLMAGGGSRNAEDPTAAAVQAKPDEPKEYQGEWYPVVRPKHGKEG